MKSSKLHAAALALLAAFFVAPIAQATVVRFNTVSGNIDVRLYNAATPLSVANFLTYVNSASFTNSLIHRSIPGFIIQGGGYYIPTGSGQVAAIPTNPPVMNEFGISNLRGTIAYAKLGATPPTPASINSATSGWFFNLADNSSNLDNQNGGFTVFGRVVGNGMTVVDSIAALGIIGLDSPFDNLPVVDYDAVVARQQVLLSDLVYVNTVSVLNYPKGDYDFNGKVDINDYNLWKNNFGSTTFADADGNGNGKVDAADYTIWRDSFNQMSGPGSGAGAAVPEPRSDLLTVVSAAILLVGWRRRIWARPYFAGTYGRRASV